MASSFNQDVLHWNYTKQAKQLKQLWNTNFSLYMKSTNIKTNKDNTIALAGNCIVKKERNARKCTLLFKQPVYMHEIFGAGR